MSDTLKEALSTWDSWRRMVEIRHPDGYSGEQLAVQDALAEAARSVIEAPSVWWCDEHNDRAMATPLKVGRFCVKKWNEAGHSNDCHMVKVALVPT